MKPLDCQDYSTHNIVVARFIGRFYNRPISTLLSSNSSERGTGIEQPHEPNQLMICSGKGSRITSIVKVSPPRTSLRDTFSPAGA